MPAVIYACMEAGIMKLLRIHLTVTVKCFTI